MAKARIAPALLLGFSTTALSPAAFAQDAAEWHNPDDIPVTQPVTVGLAGEKPADIVRYLLADGATSARLVCPASTSSKASRRRSAGSARTTSISISATAPTPTCRWKRRSGPTRI